MEVGINHTAQFMRGRYRAAQYRPNLLEPSVRTDCTTFLRMEAELQSIELNLKVFDDVKAERVRQLMRAYFPIDCLRRITGGHAGLVNFYVAERFSAYNRMQATFEDLAETGFEDFAGWTEQDFRRVDAKLLRHLLNYSHANGMSVEKRAGLAIALGMSNVFLNAETIPYNENREIRFMVTDFDGNQVAPNHEPPIVAPSHKRGSSNGLGTSSRRLCTSSAPSAPFSAKLIDITKWARSEQIYHGLSDEDFDAR